MRKKPITNDASRLSLLVTAAAYMAQKTEQTQLLSKRLCERVALLANTFSEAFEDRNTKAAIKKAKIQERTALNRTLRFAIRDAYMGLIRRARRFGKPPSTLATIIIPEERDRLSLTTNEWFELARDLIAHNQRHDTDMELSNPDIVELIDRLAKAEACSWDVDDAKALHAEAQLLTAWNRVQANAVIRQLNAELKYNMRELDRESLIDEMTRYGFEWVEMVLVVLS